MLQNISGSWHIIAVVVAALCPSSCGWLVGWCVHVCRFDLVYTVIVGISNYHHCIALALNLHYQKLSLTKSTGRVGETQAE